MRSCSFLWWKVSPEDESMSSNTSKWQKRRKRLSKSFCCFCWMKGKEIQYFWKWGTLKGTTCPSSTNYDASQTARTLTTDDVSQTARTSTKHEFSQTARTPTKDNVSQIARASTKDISQIARTSSCQVRGYRLPSNSPYLTITSHFSHLITLTYIVSLHSGESILLRWQLDVPSADFLRRLLYQTPFRLWGFICVLFLSSWFTYSLQGLTGACSFGSTAVQNTQRSLFNLGSSLSPVSSLHWEGQSWLTRPWSSPLFGQLAFQAPQQNKWLPNLLLNVCHRLKRI